MTEDFKNFSEIIRRRRTLKLRSKSSLPNLAMSEEHMQALFEVTVMAPFHLPAHAEFREGELKSIVPWRYFTLDHSECLKLKTYLLENKAGFKSVEAICEMLNSCHFMVLPVWLPFDLKKHSVFDRSAEKGMPTLNNMECIAAASASVQNLLLAATAMNKESYWYTGGIVRTDADIWNYLNIPVDQKFLLGAVFVFPKEFDQENTVTKEGANRKNRGTLNDWMQRIHISE